MLDFGLHMFKLPGILSEEVYQSDETDYWLD